MLVAPSGLTAATVSSSKINLFWVNNDSCYQVQIYRKPDGGAYSLLYQAAGSATSYTDSSCQDGTKYYYKVRGKITNPTEYSDYSNEANAVTQLPKPTGLSGSATNTTVVLTWNDNSQNESGFKVYKDGVLLITLGANVTTYTATGLSEGTWYSFIVKAYNSLITSAASNIETILTADPPNKPIDLVATPTGTTTVQLNWSDKSNNETDFRIERSSVSAVAGFAQIDSVGKNITTYADSGLVSNTQYWYRVRAHNASGYSAYCIVATAVTWAAIAAPTNLVVTAFSGTQTDIRFVDNSELEDDHRIERKTGVGAFAEIKTMEPNRTFYRDSGLVAGTEYIYRVRARQGAVYSSYSDEVTVSTFDVPGAPTNLAISEYQDTWLRLTWTPTVGVINVVETGYKIEQSSTGAWGGEEVEIAKLSCFGLSEYKVTGLTPNTEYYFRIRSYNAAGNSAYLSDVSQTTRSSYLLSKFEKLINKSKVKLNFYIEANPMMILSGWTHIGLGIYTTSFDERGAEINAIYQNGVELTNYGYIAIYPGSWYHDINAKIVYVVPFDLDDPLDSDTPDDYLITATFWLYFSTAKNQIFNSHDYLPLIPIDGIPDITQEMQQYCGDNFVITSGTISLINGWLNKEFFFDRRFERYVWLNQKMIILAGGDDFTYDELKIINTGIIDSATISDQRTNFNLRDYRSNLHKMLPLEKYSLDEFPFLESSAEGKERPFGFGTITNAIPNCIDTTNRVFEFHNGQCKSVTQLVQNGTALVEDTDFFVDYGLGRFTLARALAYTTNDILLIDFHGLTDSADDEIEKPAETFKYVSNEWLGVLDSNLSLDSIWATNAEKITALQLYVWKEIGSQELIRLIEQSSMTYSFQDANGRLGLKTQQTTAPSDIRTISKTHVLNFSMDRTQENIYAVLNLYYGENYSIDKYTPLIKPLDTVQWLYKVSKPLDVYVALASLADATTLADLVIADLIKKRINFDVPRILYNSFPGDLIYFNRDRFPSSSGSANNLLLRILSITKAYTSGQTNIKAEIV